MKHIFKTTFLLILLFHFLRTALIAQDTKSGEENFVFQKEIMEDFKKYLNSINDIEELNESDSVIAQSFLKSHYLDHEKIILYKKEHIEDYYKKDSKDNIILWGLDLTRKDMIPLVQARRDELSSHNTESNNPEEGKRAKGTIPQYWFWIVAIVLVIALLFILKSKKKEHPVITPPNNRNNNGNDSDNNIVVRRKTTSVLRKQSLEDVIDNENYLKIDCSEFCDDSAVRRIYLKNTCIKEIYNMYAEDLRNPDNPKEDGCMVLGRWVYDQESDEYYVSLEHAVFPGDDAVFSEYELNFGAKIKINIMTKLRKLRQETQLQYDLTCWVHSHPGIGVFFSNTDYSLHMLHKHPTHPKFLTAIVVDILTPRQDLGIFTFKKDMSMNSKADLKKMYTLDEWYKWAVESSRNAFKPEDHFNTLQDVKERFDGCHDIQLNNGAIIDMGLLATEHQDGYIGRIHGFVKHNMDKIEYVATSVSAAETGKGNDTIGSFIITTHCSIPSVRKALAGLLDNNGFVMVYSTADGLLTSIPIVDNDLCTDPNYYGEQQLEDLKIWTRRKR